MSQEVEATIDAIAAGGAGVTRVDGLVVFVPRAAPGDRVAMTFRAKGRMGEGRLTKVLEPSPARTRPLCPHYEGDQCGGCQLQHLRYEAQLEAKRRIIGDALARIGKRVVEVPPVTPSASEWRYRNRLTLAMRWRAGEWTLGLHRWDNVDAIFQMRECPITDGRVVDAWREIAAAARYLPRTPELRGSVRRLGASCAFVLEGGSEWHDIQHFAAQTPSLSVIRWYAATGERRVMVDRSDATGPSASFDQVNATVAAALHEWVFQRVVEASAATVIDAYSGAGALAARIASTGAIVTAIELDREASAHAAKLLAAPSVAVCARVEDTLPRALPSDVVILNPPRTGVDAKVCETLENVRQPPRLLLYVSCNPATLARDLTRLPRYRVADIVPFDMFPQTAHVETVCALVPEKS